MNKLLSLMMAGSLGIASVPAAFAQSMSSDSSSSMTSSSSSLSSSSLWSSSSSSSSDDSSSARYYSRPSSASSYSSLSTRTRVRSLPSSSSSSSSSSTRTRTRSSSSDSVAPGAFGGENGVRSLIPDECADLGGRALAQCVIRLSQRSSVSSSSSLSSTSSMAGSGTMLTSDETLRQLFRMSVGEGTRIDVMRHLCGMVMGDFVSTCAQGESNLSEFNRHLNVWFVSLGHALSDFMTDLNRDGTDMSDDYFWNDKAFPWMGSGSSMTGSGMVKGWQWMNDTTDDALLDDASEKDDTVMDGGMSSDTHSQRAAWDACTDREGAGKARCIRQYIEQQNIEQNSGEAL